MEESKKEINRLREEVEQLNSIISDTHNFYLKNKDAKIDSNDDQKSVKELQRKV